MRFSDTVASTRLLITLGSIAMGNRNKLNRAKDVKMRDAVNVLPARAYALNVARDTSRGSAVHSSTLNWFTICTITE